MKGQAKWEGREIQRANWRAKLRPVMWLVRIIQERGLRRRVLGVLRHQQASPVNTREQRHSFLHCHRRRRSCCLWQHRPSRGATTILRAAVQLFAEYIGASIERPPM